MISMAKKRIFKSSLSDFSSRLAEETLTIGLARVLSLQGYLGYDPDAIMICLPGTTPTGGADRLQKGFSSGAVLRYGYSSANSNKEPLVVLNPKVNCCGVLVGSFRSDLPSKNDLMSRINRLRREQPTINGIKIILENYFIGNHFVNIYQQSSFNDDRFWIAIHGSGEMRQDSNLGMGVFIDESLRLQNIARRYITPLGDIYYLLGEDAEFFVGQCQKLEEISARSREHIAKEIISDLDIFCNFCHLNIIAPGNYFLGAYNTVPGKIYPFLISEKDGIALMKAKQNFSAQAIKELGWSRRASEMGIWEILQSINGLPHGGRKVYKQGDYQLVDVYFDGKKIMFIVSDSGRVFSIDNLKQLGKIIYRGKDELAHIQRLGMADEVGRLLFGDRGYSLNANSVKI